MEFQLNEIEFNITNPNTVHFDKENIGLLDKNILSKCVENNDNVLYYGCGTGIIGILLLKFNLANHIHFIDIDPLAIKYSRINVINNKLDINNHTFSVIDISNIYNISNIQKLIDYREIYDFIICNPPQFPGPIELLKLRPDKYGGYDGLFFYKQIIENANKLHISKIIFMQTSFSIFDKLDTIFKNNNYIVKTIKYQVRSISLVEINTISSNLLEYLLELKRQKTDIFNIIENTIYYKQRIASASIK